MWFFKFKKYTYDWCRIEWQGKSYYNDKDKKRLGIVMAQNPWWLTIYFGSTKCKAVV